MKLHSFVYMNEALITNIFLTFFWKYFPTYAYKTWRHLGPFAQTCNPTKWEADIWGWLEIRRSAMLHYTVNQRLHWACRQYGHSGGTWGWLGVKRCQLCLQDTSRSAKRHRQTAVCHWVSLFMKCCRMVDSEPIWQLSLSRPIQSDHLSIADQMIPPLGLNGFQIR